MNKIKSGVWILFWIHVFNCWLLGRSDDVLSFLGSDDKEYCLTNGTSAMYYTSRNGGLYEGTELLPRSPYFCDFEDKNDNKCLNDFKKLRNGYDIVNSLNNENLPIFDMRWEDLPVEEVYSNKKSTKRGKKQLSFKKVLDVENGNNFEITLSVRTTEIHLLLCDIQEITEASCYWFILQGWQGKSTVLRKCYKQISDVEGAYPKEPCKYAVVNITHSEDFRPFLGMNKWSHVTIGKQGQNLYLRNIQNGIPETIIEYTDEINDIEVKYLLGHSKDSVAYYKLHQNRYLRTSEHSDQYTFFSSSYLYGQEGNICFSAMLTTCQQCSSTITAFRVDGEQLISIGEMNVPPSHGVWTEHKLIKYIEAPYNFFIGMRTTLNTTYKNFGEPFWSIDNFRQCHEKEYRVSKKAVKQLKTCYLLYPAKESSWQELEHSYMPNTECERWDEFGDTCIPCNLLTEDKKLSSCDKLRTCEFTSNGSKCFCSPGYIGPECNEACESDTYGYGCSRQCGNCLGDNQCRVQDGVCQKCANGFEEALCQIPKDDIILKYPPSVIESNSTSCTVQLVNKDYLGRLEFIHYLVQYQKDAPSSSRNVASGGKTWIDWGSLRKIDDYDTVVVEGLQSSTAYRIRILVASEESRIKALQNAKVPFSVCNTTCDAWKESDITITPGNASVHIAIKLSKIQCKISFYNWTLQDEFGKNILANNMTVEEFTIGPLAIFKNYTIVFGGLSSIVKKFRTTESVPSDVHEVNPEESNIDTIRLNWKEPRQPNGIIDHYRITYRKIRGLFCVEKKWEGSEERNVSFTSIELTNLSAFSVYVVTIHAVNNKFESKGLSIEVQTAAIDEFSEAEGLAQVELTVTAVYERSAILSLANLLCQNLRGPLLIKYECKCTSEWCDSTEAFTGNASKDRTISILNLQPYSNYSCSFLFCRKTNCKIVLQKEFKTAASYPNNIRELLVTSKGTNYINLRWLPPYPPTGTLVYYRITTSCESCYTRHRTSTQLDPKNCSRWPLFNCVVLTSNIFVSYNHAIEIEAANEENLKFVKVHTMFEVKVVESSSEPPYGLKTRWYKNNTLDLFWNHPNITNGNLKSFKIEISVTHEPTTIYNYPISEREEKLTYHVRLFKRITPSRDVHIKVYAENAYKGKPATKTDSSFPIDPNLINPKISITSSTETTISISLNISLKNDDKNNAKYLFLLRSEPTTQMKDPNLLQLEKKLNESIDLETNLRLVAEINLNYWNTTLFNFVVGQNDQNMKSAFLNTEISNMPLQEAQYYNISVLIVNDYKKKYKSRVYSIRSLTQGNPRMTTEARSPNDGEPEEPTEENGALYALFLLLLIPIIMGFMIYYKKKFQSSPPISVGKLMEAAIINPAQSRSQNDVLLLESKEPSPLLTSPNVIVKTKISRKSTNPPNQAEKIYSKPVKVANFEEYVKQALQSGELARQHSLFPRGQTQPWTYGSMKVNKTKNRYNNLLAYDHSRVKLAKIPGDEYSDYINASYVHGYNVPRAYIATQGPKSSTLVDFWRMIWQENVKHIVMLANIIENGKKKVEQYWPNINEELVFGNISVQYISMETFADFEYKKFHVICENEMRKLEQLHFTSWPDHGVPLYPQSLVPFVRKILKIPQSSSSPIVVHCSAGVGRTGTILLADICLRMAAKEGVLDMLNNLQKLREQRSNMVDNVEQYKLVHLIVLESLMGLHTSIPCNNIDRVITKLINEEEYKIQMDYLKETEWQDEAMMTTEDLDEEFVIYSEKNRFQDIVPDKRSRIFLTRYPSEDSSSSYINAVKVDGFRCPNRFIVTQQPMPNTLNDFWRLVVERNTSVIVSLNPTNIRDETCCHFYPTADNPELRPTDFILIKFEKKVTLDNYDIHYVRVFVANYEEHFDVEIISFKRWPCNSNLPSSCEEFLSFWEEADTISRRSKTILVTCYDGKTASGVYVALCFVIEKIKLEQECDVCLAVRNIRHNRKQFVSEESQFVFLYEAALRYINGFESYANFQNQ